ncbi:MAG TPA: hypothetical protein VFV52_12070 [Bacilli bacterium]|nr:hypothetical protein [Bacilli bacterium]
MVTKDQLIGKMGSDHRSEPMTVQQLVQERLTEYENYKQSIYARVQEIVHRATGQSR